MPGATNDHLEAQAAPKGAGPLDPEPAKISRRRIDSVDLLRGIVMVIMIVDHTRDFVHSGALVFDPLELSETTVSLFLTGGITHDCATVVVFVSVAGVYM